MTGVVVPSKLRVRNVRAQLRLTQEQLRELSGISGPTLSRAETGKPIRALTAQRLLETLNTERAKRGLSELQLDDLDWVIEGDGDD